MDIAEKKFFDRYGYLANMDQIYIESIMRILLQYLKQPRMEDIVSDNMDMDYKSCLLNAKSYEWRIVSSNIPPFQIPRMVEEKGYFIIDGVMKNTPIHELKSNRNVFTSIDDDKYRTIRAETQFRGSNIPFRIVFNLDTISVDITLIQKDIKARKLPECTSIPLHILLYAMMGFSKSEIDRVFSQFGIWSRFRVVSDTEDNILFKEVYYEIIETKYFSGELNKKQILFTIAYLLKRAIHVFEKIEEPCDRDDYMFKTLRSSGPLVASLLKICFDEYFDTKKNIETDFETGSTISNRSKNKKKLQAIIYDRIYSVFKIGTSTLNGKKYTKLVIDTGKRNPLDTLSSVRKVIIPIDENTSNLRIRDLHDSQKKFICPAETPEDKHTGLTRSLALTTILSGYIDIADVNEYLSRYVNTDFDLYENSKSKDERVVLIDGYVIGRSKPDDRSISNILNIKSTFPYISIVMDDFFIFIRSFEGRVMRPICHGRNVYVHE